MSRIKRISYAITPEGHRANAIKQAVDLRDKVLSIVDDSNFSTSTARKITKKAAFSVVMRSLEASKGLPLSLREHLAMKELNNYISLAKHNKSDFFYASNTDLLPISHPRSTREHSMTASALRISRSRWFAADPRITDERAKAVLASAFESVPGSVEHLYYTSILLSLPQGIVPGDALIAATDGNSFESRSARARRQRRDRKGQFAYEGGGIRALIRRLNGEIFSISGRVVANAKNSRDVEVEFPDGKIAQVNPVKGEYIKAVLPTPDGYSPKPIVPSVSEEVIDEKDLVFLDAPNGWVKDKAFKDFGDKVERYVDSNKEFAVLVSKKDDGTKDYQILNAKSDEEIGVVNTWAEVQDRLEGKEDQILNQKAELPKQQAAPVGNKGGFEYNYPDNAYKIRQDSEYDVQGRIDEESPDFTDDPVELAQNQDERDLLAALEQAVSPGEDGGNALGVGALPFGKGDEFVPAEAIFFALQEAGMDAPMELAKIYDKELGDNSNEKALNDFRKKEEVVSGNIPELAESFKKGTEQNPDLEPPTEEPKFDAKEADSAPLPALLEGLSEKELEQFMETKDHIPYLPKNEEIEMPEGYNPLSPEPFAAWKEVTAENPDAVLPEGFSDNPVYLAQEIPTNDLLKELRRSVEPGNEVPGAAVIALPTEDGEDFVANVPGEAVRDALQLKGVDTNAELKKIADEGFVGQKEEPVAELPEVMYYVDEDGNRVPGEAPQASPTTPEQMEKAKQDLRRNMEKNLPPRQFPQEPRDDRYDARIDPQAEIPLDLPVEKKPMNAYERMMAENKAAFDLVAERRAKLDKNMEDRVDEQGRSIPEGWGIERKNKPTFGKLDRPENHFNIYGNNNFEATVDADGKIIVKDRNNILPDKSYDNWEDLQADLENQKSEYSSAARERVREIAKEYGYSDEQIASFDLMSQQELADFFANPENQTEAHKSALDDLNNYWAVDLPNAQQKARWDAIRKNEKILGQAGDAPSGVSGLVIFGKELLTPEQIKDFDSEIKKVPESHIEALRASGTKVRIMDSPKVMNKDEAPHFNRENNEIRLDKNSGASALLHEIGHALDFNAKSGNGFLSDDPNFRKIIKDSKFPDFSKQKNTFARNEEFAVAYENYYTDGGKFIGASPTKEFKQVMEGIGTYILSEKAAFVGEYKPTADQIDKLQKGIAELDWLDEGIMFLKPDDGGPRADAPIEIYDDNGLAGDGPFAKIDVDGNFEWKDEQAYNKYADRLKEILDADLEGIGDNQAMQEPQEIDNVPVEQEKLDDNKVEKDKTYVEENPEVIKVNAFVEANAGRLAPTKARDVRRGDFLWNNFNKVYEEILDIQPAAFGRVRFLIKDPRNQKEYFRFFDRRSPIRNMRRPGTGEVSEGFKVAPEENKGDGPKRGRALRQPLEQRVEVVAGRDVGGFAYREGFYKDKNGVVLKPGDKIRHGNPKKNEMYGEGVVLVRAGDQIDEAKKVGGIGRGGKVYKDYVWVQIPGEAGPRLWKARMIVKQPDNAGPDQGVPDGMPEQVYNNKFQDKNDVDFEINLIKIGDVYEGALINKDKEKIQIVIRTTDKQKAIDALADARDTVKFAANGDEAMADVPNLDKVNEAPAIADDKFAVPLMEPVVRKDKDKDLQEQIRRAIDAGDEVSFNYNGKTRYVKPVKIWKNPVNDNVNITAIENGEIKNFTISKMGYIADPEGAAIDRVEKLEPLGVEFELDNDNIKNGLEEIRKGIKKLDKGRRINALRNAETAIDNFVRDLDVKDYRGMNITELDALLRRLRRTDGTDDLVAAVEELKKIVEPEKQRLQLDFERNMFDKINNPLEAVVADAKTINAANVKEVIDEIAKRLPSNAGDGAAHRLGIARRYLLSYAIEIDTDDSLLYTDPKALTEAISYLEGLPVDVSGIKKQLEDLKKSIKGYAKNNKKPFGKANMPFIDPIALQEKRIADGVNKFDLASAQNLKALVADDQFFVDNSFAAPYKDDLQKFFAQDGEVPLASLSVDARQVLSQIISAKIRDIGTGSDEAKKARANEYARMALGLHEEKLAFNPNREDLGPAGEALKDIDFNAVFTAGQKLNTDKPVELRFNGQSTGFRIQRVGAGINASYNYRMIDIASGQIFYFKRERTLETADAEYASNQLARALKIAGVPVVVKHNNDAQVLIMTNAGDSLDFEKDPTVAGSAGQDYTDVAARAAIADLIGFGVLDAVIANSDRHSHNFLLGGVDRGNVDGNGREEIQILPIDHGFAELFQKNARVSDPLAYMTGGDGRDGGRINKAFAKDIGAVTYKELIDMTIQQAIQAIERGDYLSDVTPANKQAIIDRLLVLKGIDVDKWKSNLAKKL